MGLNKKCLSCGKEIVPKNNISKNSLDFLKRKFCCKECYLVHVRRANRDGCGKWTFMAFKSKGEL